MSDSQKNIGKFWLRDSKKAPVTLVAWVLEGDRIRYAVATHNPPDAFNRKRAHDKASGRLLSKTESKSFQIVKGPGFEIAHSRMVASSIAKHIVDTQRGNVDLPPPRIYEAALISLSENDGLLEPVRGARFVSASLRRSN